ncbi:hypothetical protein [Botrimarina mediterranea]|uniref:Uncharacterized protein n=1 Tax=Botrimarina mediterranea TaxID=2528022 RepID=A0A518KEA0_9BACT|nr:hypothetical protein [Botrimarina mediterranea]QDV76117.1 hypothetical protein Spa11_43420 [Botrimarina mediterranea]QDV80715.1 hypothetical protein K2D_43450 [Planctomycetes bacterium K2D]
MEIYGSTFAGASAVLMARVAYADGTLVAPEEIASAAYAVAEVDPCGLAPPTDVAGHTGVALDVEQVLSTELLDNPPWEVDEVGFNFRHEVDVTESPAFVTAGRRYRVQYVLTPTDGQPIVVRFFIEAL